MNEKLEILKDIIRHRRSNKPARMNGQLIDDNILKEILSVANWAPTHGRTEPWRFYVYPPGKVKAFCLQHAELYKAHTAAENFKQETYDKQLHNGDMVSHIVIAVMKRGENPKITVLEEIAATAAAIQNVLLAASAAGIACLWSTGGMILKPAMKELLRLKEDDIVMGMLYMGYSNDNTEGRRNSPIEEKTYWQ